MRYFFIIQGEGMGHTTQSLALRAILEKNGHTVSNIFLGRNFFSRENEFYHSLEHETFLSPVFVGRRDKTGINLFRTFAYNLLLSPLYIFSIIRIAFRIRRSDAQAVIVFYDLIGQLGSFFSFSGKAVYSVSHHFFFDHPVFRWPNDRRTGQLMLRIHSSVASVGARKKLALSFTMEPDIPGRNLYVVPPLLRPEITGLIAETGDNIHIYLLQPGFLRSVIILAGKTPQREFMVFTAGQDKSPELPANLHVSGISAGAFRESLRKAGLVICTAGFETLAEAIYLNKALVIVPSKGHFEQYCNAMDALRTGAATVEDNFLPETLPAGKNNPAHSEFRSWISKAEEIVLKHLTN